MIEPHMPDDNLLHITLCMGSSCFSRGNNRNIELVQNYLQAKKLTARVDLRGHLCENQCKSGPNVLINGKLYQQVDPVTMLGLLNYHFDRKESA